MSAPQARPAAGSGRHRRAVRRPPAPRREPQRSRRGIVAIIGPNGAGKTRCSTASAAFTSPRPADRVRWPRPRAPVTPDVAALGIARTFQNVALFRGMSVLDNIMTGRIPQDAGQLPPRRAVVGTGAPANSRTGRSSSGSSTSWRSRPSARRRPASAYGLQKRVGWPGRWPPSRNCCCSTADGGMNVEEKEDMCRFILDVSGEFGTTIADRARHGRGDGHLRSRGRPRLRSPDHNGTPSRSAGPGRPRRYTGVAHGGLLGALVGRSRNRRLATFFVECCWAASSPACSTRWWRWASC